MDIRTKTPCNGSRIVIDTNIIGFATLAKHGVPVISVAR